MCAATEYVKLYFGFGPQRRLRLTGLI